MQPEQHISQRLCKFERVPKPLCRCDTVEGAGNLHSTVLVVVVFNGTNNSIEPAADFHALSLCAVAIFADAGCPAGGFLAKKVRGLATVHRQGGRHPGGNYRSTVIPSRSRRQSSSIEDQR